MKKQPKKKKSSRRKKRVRNAFRQNAISNVMNTAFEDLPEGTPAEEPPAEEPPAEEPRPKENRPYRFRTFAMCNMMVMIHGDALDNEIGGGDVPFSLYVDTTGWHMTQFEQFLIQIQIAIESGHRIEWNDHQLNGSILPERVSISGIVEGKKKRVFMDE
jgi:hypothetical protein